MATPTPLIDAQKLERGERLIRVLFQTGTWPASALTHFRIEEDGFKKFAAHQVGTLRAMYPDIDPRHESAIATMLSHMFFCGVAAGRAEGYSGDSGLNT